MLMQTNDNKCNLYNEGSYTVAAYFFLQFGETSIAKSTLYDRPKATSFHVRNDILTKNLFLTTLVDTMYWLITAIFLLFPNDNAIGTNILVPTNIKSLTEYRGDGTGELANKIKVTKFVWWLVSE